MKFEIEVKEFWIEDEELSEALIGRIKREVVDQISKNIKNQVEVQITKKVNEIVHEKVSLVIDNTLTDLIATGVLKQRGDLTVTIVDHVKEVFNKHHGWNNPDEQMKKLAKKFGEELKIQYNNIFANKIVQNMKEQGLLKNEVVQMLLDGK